MTDTPKVARWLPTEGSLLERSSVGWFVSYEDYQRDLAAANATIADLKASQERLLRECKELAERAAADLAAANAWKEAVLDELIVAHIYTNEHEANPRKAIQDAITWNCQVALDPAVSSDARALIAAANARVDTLHDALNLAVKYIEPRVKNTGGHGESVVMPKLLAAITKEKPNE